MVSRVPRLAQQYDVVLQSLVDLGMFGPKGLLNDGQRVEKAPPAVALTGPR